eukprot:361144-Chlamydomonas_euryale.AAC.2
MASARSLSSGVVIGCTPSNMRHATTASGPPPPRPPRSSTTASTASARDGTMSVAAARRAGGAARPLRKSSSAALGGSCGGRLGLFGQLAVGRMVGAPASPSPSPLFARPRPSSHFLSVPTCSMMELKRSSPQSSAAACARHAAAARATSSTERSSSGCCATRLARFIDDDRGVCLMTAGYGGEREGKERGTQHAGGAWLGALEGRWKGAMECSRTRTWEGCSLPLMHQTQKLPESGSKFRAEGCARTTCVREESMK